MPDVAGPAPAVAGERSERRSHHEGRRCHRRDPEARRSHLPHRLSRQHDHRGGRPGRHPDDHRPPGARRPAHGRRREPGELRARRSASSRCSMARAPRTASAASRRRTATRCRSWSCPAAIHGGSPTFRPTSIRALNYRHITKWCEQVTAGRREVPNAMRRAFTQVRNGRPRPVLVEIPGRSLRRGGAGAARVSADASRRAPRPTRGRSPTWPACWSRRKRPVIYAGQGVHYAQAWPQLRELAELLEAPVTTSLQGKSAFPENHPLSLGSGGRSIPKPAASLPA